MKMLLFKVNLRLCGKHSATYNCRFASVAAATNVSNREVTVPQYPPIKDLTPLSRWRERLEDRQIYVKNVKTAEEKLIKVNMPRYWGFNCLMVHEDRVFYNELPMIQYVTRTHIPEESKLPSYYDNLVPEEKLNSLVQEIKQSFDDGIAFEVITRMHNQEHSQNRLESAGVLDDIIGDAVCKQVNRIMMNSLGLYYPHLLTTQVDYDPRIEAYWYAGGIEMARNTRISLLKNYRQDLLKEPSDRIFQYLGSPTLQLRHQLPLKPILSEDECENANLTIPVCKFDPRIFGHYSNRRHITAIPGFWPGDQSEFGLMSYHKRGFIHRRSKSLDDQLDVLKTQAVNSNWGWLISQACNLGFSTFNEITYPLVNQLIITNGQMWTFSTYQLNTNKVWGRYCDENPKTNICWITEPMKLYEKIEDNKLVGVNDDVLRNLVKFYINAPEERAGVNLRPYLGETERRIADIKEDKRRVWLENNFKIIMSNRSRHRLMPEMYHWEWVYKFMFKTRPMDKKRHHWDFDINPFTRRLDEHRPPYIPKFQRPDKVIRNSRDKYDKTYYP